MTNAFLRITKIVGGCGVGYNKNINDYIDHRRNGTFKVQLLSGARKKTAMPISPIIPELQANITPAAKPKPSLT